jgi:endonuclease YncB( thermonuclease family)
LLAVLLTSPFGLAACGDSGALDGLTQGRQGRVTGVVSGDTLEIDGADEVRLAGVEAPHGDAPYATEARAALERLVDGRRIELLYGGAHTDPFGRMVAHVREVQSRRWIEGALIDAGAVRVRTFADNRALAGVMLAREAAARGAKRGLWAFRDYRVALPGEVSREDRGLIVVEGRVRRVGRAGEDVYLDFSDDWRGSLSAEIPAAAMRDFRSAGIDPYDLQGRLIRVRGAVHALRLVLDHPEQVELLKG